MECASCKQPISRTTAWRNHHSGDNTGFCCYECDGFFRNRGKDKNRGKNNKPRRVKPSHRDFED